MNDDIKEILDRFNFVKKEPNKLSYYPEDLLSREDMWLLYDYITNLQQENERLKEENKHIFANVNDDELLRSNAMNWAEAQDYKLRIEKVIRILETLKGSARWERHLYEIDNMLDTLNGRSDE